MKLLRKDVKLPTKGIENSVGTELYSAEEVVLSPREITIVLNDIAIKFPKGTYMRVASGSSLAEHVIDYRGEAIDPDYRGNIKVIMRNDTDVPYQLKKESKLT